MAKDKVDKSKVVNRLHKLTKSSENIKKMSAYMMQFNRGSGPQQIGEAWLEAMKKATDDQRKLTLIYVANEIVQTCKKHDAGEFRKVWKKFIPNAAACLSGCSYYDKIKHIFDIWGQRGIFEPAYIKHILSKMEPPEHPPVDPEPGVSDDFDLKIIDSYKPEEALESLRRMEQLERDEAEVEQITYQLEKSARAEMSTVKGVQETKDLASKWCECSNQWETLMHYAKDHIHSSQKIKEMLKKAEIFYHAQYKDASVVYKAYRNYGNRISQVKKRASQQITALSAGLSSYTELVTLDDDHEAVGDDTPEYLGLESRIGRLCQQEAQSPQEPGHGSPPSHHSPTPPLDQAAVNLEDHQDQNAAPVDFNSPFPAGLTSALTGAGPPPQPNILPGLPPPPPPPPVPTGGLFPNYNSASESGGPGGYSIYPAQDMFSQYYLAANSASLYGQQTMNSLFDSQPNFYPPFSQFPTQQQLDDERQKFLEDEFIKRMNAGQESTDKVKIKESRSKKSKRKKSRRTSRSESRDRDHRETEGEEEFEDEVLSDSADNVKKSKHSKKHKRRSQSSHSNSPSESRSHKKSDKYSKDRRSVTPPDSLSPRHSVTNKKHSKYEDKEESPHYEKHRDKGHKGSDRYRDSESTHSHEERYRNKETAHSSSSRSTRHKHQENDMEERYDSLEEEDYHHHSKRSDYKKEKEKKHSRHPSSSSREDRKKSSSHKDDQSDHKSGRSADHKRRSKKESPDHIEKSQILQSVNTIDKHEHSDADHLIGSSYSTNKNRDRKHTNSSSDKRRYDDLKEYTNSESRSGRYAAGRGLHDSPHYPADSLSPYYDSPGKMAKLDDTPEHSSYHDERNAEDYEGGDTPTQDELRESPPQPGGGAHMGVPLSQPPPSLTSRYPPATAHPHPNPAMFTCPPPNNNARFLPNASVGLPGTVSHLPPRQVMHPPPHLATQNSVSMPPSSMTMSQMPPVPLPVANQPGGNSNSPSKIAASWGAWRQQSRPIPSLPSLNPVLPSSSVSAPDTPLNLSPRVSLMRHGGGPAAPSLLQQHLVSNDLNSGRYLTVGDLNSTPPRPPPQNQPVSVDSAFPHRPAAPGGSPRIRFNLRLGAPPPHGVRPYPGPRFRGDRPRLSLPYFPNQSKTFRPRDPTQHFLK